jgi:hypothetical protein
VEAVKALRDAVPALSLSDAVALVNEATSLPEEDGASDAGRRRK